jgi:hypothetical protein
VLRYKESEKSGASVGNRERRIRCPKCKWQPQRSSRWICKCRHVWNTFDTHGVCPACSYAWRDTKCPHCKQWSPHADWYGDD